MNANTIKPQEKSKTKLNMLEIMFNPLAYIEKKGKVNIKLSFLICSIAYCLFFMQTGFDMYRYGTGDFKNVVILSILGIIISVIINILGSAIIWFVLKINNSCKSYKAILFITGYAYMGSLIFMVFGIVMNLLFKWNTAIATGVTGVLWACGPIFINIRRILKGKEGAAVFATTAFGLLALCSWYIIAV